MLFLSRYINSDFFGVVDTDDDVEQVVDLFDLQKACCSLKLKIEGVNPLHMGGGVWMSEDCITVYQPPETVSTLQTKTKVLKNVTVLTYKSMITAIRWEEFDILEPVAIRPSDFGDSCAEYLFAGQPHSRQHKITIVLDNKVSFTKLSFMSRNCDPSFVGVKGVGVVFDLRELNDHMASVVYSMLFDYYSDAKEILASVYDSARRISQMLARFYHPMLEDV